jgi:hypothetical protein
MNELILLIACFVLLILATWAINRMRKPLVYYVRICLCLAAVPFVWFTHTGTIYWAIILMTVFAGAVFWNIKELSTWIKLNKRAF